MLRLMMFTYMIFLCTVLFAQSQTSVLPVTTYQPAGIFKNQSSNPHDFMTHGSNMFFQAGLPGESQLFRSDGLDVFEVVTPDGVPLGNNGDEGYAPRVLGDELFAFGYHQDQMGLWLIRNDSGLPQLVDVFEIGPQIRMAHTGGGLLIANFLADAVEMRYFDGQTAHHLDNLPKSDPASWLAVNHGDDVFFVLGSLESGYQLWQWDGSGVSEFANVNSPQLSNGNYAKPGEGASLLSYEDGLALVRTFSLDGRRVWTICQIDSNAEVRQLLEVGGQVQNHGLGSVFVLEDRLYFDMSNAGLHYLDGSEVVSFETLVPRFDDANPNMFLPAEGGFFYAISDPGTNNTDNQVQWFDLKTMKSTLLFSHPDDWAYDLNLGSDGRAWFQTVDGSQFHSFLFSSVWSTDGTQEGTRELVHSLDHYSSFGVLGDTVFYSRRNGDLGVEPVISNGGVEMFLGDLVTAPHEYRGEIGGQNNFASGRVLVTSADDGSEQLLALEGTEARILASLGDIVADAAMTVAGRIFVFTQDRSQLYEVTQAGLTLLAEYPPGELRMSRVLIFDDQLYYTAYADNLYQSGGANGLDLESTLYRYNPDGQDQMIGQMDDYGIQQLAVADLGGSLIHSGIINRHYSVLAWRDGASRQLVEIPASLNRMYIQFYGMLEDTLIVSASKNRPSGVPHNRGFSEHMFYAVTPDGAQLLWQGLALGSRWINNRIVLAAENQILAVDLDGVESVFDFSDTITFHRDQESAFYFNYQDDMWISDGTPAGTRVYLPGMSQIKTLGRAAGYHYFYDPTIKHENAPLMVVGPDDETPQLVADAPIIERWYAGLLTVHRDRLYFRGFTSAHGEELWRLEGARAHRVTDLQPGPLSSRPFGLASTPSGLYFQTGSETGSGFDVHLLVEQDQPDEPEQPQEDQLSLSVSGELKPFRGARAKLLNLPAGARVSWRIQGGTVFARPQADTVIFKVGAGPVLNLTAEITLDGEVQTLTSQAVVSPLDLALGIVTY